MCPRDGLPGLPERLDQLQQLPRLERLGEVRRGAGLLDLRLRHRLVAPGEHHDGDVCQRLDLSYLPGEPQAVPGLHVQVGQDQIGHQIPRPGQSLLAVVHRDELDLLLAYDHPNGGPNGLAIVGQQDGERHRIGSKCLKIQGRHSMWALRESSGSPCHTRRIV